MLTLRLTPGAPVDWTWNGTSYSTSGQDSVVTPYAHPMAEQLAITDGTRTLLVIRERVGARPACPPQPRTTSVNAYEQALAAARQWPADYILIESAPRHPVRVTAGSARTTPLYLTHRDGVLHGSWDMADLREYATGLSPREAARLLIYRPRYGTETLFPEIHRLTERATAIYGGGLSIHYPEAALHAAPRDLCCGADVLAVFTEAIDNALDQRPLDPDSTVFHLTGGFDSGTIATRAAQRWPGRLDTAALLIIGAGREQQIRRRKQILTLIPFGKRDLLIDCADHPPLHPDCPRVRGELISPYEEPLFLPFSRLTSLIAEQGTRTIVTGLGGDEMVALSPEESATAAAANAHITEKLPWLGPAARAALEFSEDAIAPPAVVNAITLLSPGDDRTATAACRDLAAAPLHRSGHDPPR